MSASIDRKTYLNRGAIPDAVAATAEFPLISVLATKLSQFRRLLSVELGCEHEQLVFDEINDVYCKYCRKDFTG